MPHHKQCKACNFQTLNVDMKVCARCGEPFVAVADEDLEPSPIVEAAGKAAASKKRKRTKSEE